MIIFVGPQGSGKGTQAALLAEKYNAGHLSTGDMLRSSLDAQVHHKLESGQLFDDESMTAVLKEALDRLPPDQKIILDGYPRNLEQMRLLDDLLQQRHEPVEKVIYLTLPRAESFKRMRNRSRADDTEKAIEQRLKQFEAETLPLVSAYKQRGLLEEVDGVGSVEAVADRVAKVIPWHS